MVTKETKKMELSKKENEKTESLPMAGGSTPGGIPTTATQASTSQASPEDLKAVKPPVDTTQNTHNPTPPPPATMGEPSTTKKTSLPSEKKKRSSTDDEAGKEGKTTVPVTKSANPQPQKVKNDATTGGTSPEVETSVKASSSENSGNDRVTIDQSHRPLVQVGPGPVTTESSSSRTKDVKTTSSRAESISTKTIPKSSATTTKVTPATNTKAVASGKTKPPPPPTAREDKGPKKESSSTVTATTKTATRPTVSAAKKPASSTGREIHTGKIPSHIETTSSSGSGGGGAKTTESKFATTPSSSNTNRTGSTMKSSSGAAVVAIASAPATTTNTTVTSASSVAESSSEEPVIPMDEVSLLEEATRKLRAPLVDAYAPYIVPSDTSLKDARQRLHTALEQTRKLRSAFTERVYGKYRVCLQPPPTVETILKEIRASPHTISLNLEEEITTVKEEKEIEKKEAHKLNAEITAATAQSGSNTPPAGVNADNAEQLMYLTAGLSLILLPESDVSGIDMSSYPERAPVNPETGQRVRSISAAAAAAGDVMLDRARKAAMMRQERKKKRQHQTAAAAGDNPDKDSESDNYSRLALLLAHSSGTATTTPSSVPATTTATTTTKQPIPTPVASSSLEARIAATPAATKATTSKAALAPTKKATTTATKATTPVAKPVAAVAVKAVPATTTTTTTKSSQTTATPSTTKAAAAAKPVTATKSSRRPSSSKKAMSAAAAAANAKQIRARVQTNMPVQTLLSMHPSAEELRTDGKQCGATIALLERGVGSHGLHAKQPPHHPFPESLAARRRPSQQPTSTSGKNSSSVQQPYNGPHSLPPLPVPTSKDRRGKPRIKLLESRQAGTRRAMDAIACALDQFTINSNNKKGKDGSDVEEKKSERTTTAFQPKKRRVTEIDILHGIQKSKPSNAFKLAESGAPSSSSTGGGPVVRQKRKIDPVLAFNVLRSVGLIKTAPNDDVELTLDDGKDGVLSSLIDSSSILQSIDTKTEGDHGWQNCPSVSKVKALSQKILSHKRPFTEAFSERYSIVRSRPERSVPKGAPPPVAAKQEKKVVESLKVSAESIVGVDDKKTEAPALPVVQVGQKEEPASSKKEEDKVDTGNQQRVTEQKASPAVVSIRGGGDALLGGGGNNNNKSNPNQNPGQQNASVKPAESESSGDTRRDATAGKDKQQQQQPQPPQQQQQQQQRAPTRPQNAQMPAAAPQGQQGADMAAHRMMWEDPSRHSLVLLNPRLAGPESGYGMPNSSRQNLLPHGTGPNAMPGNHMQVPVGHYHHHSTANALQLAHHLRHATASINRLPSQQQGGHPGSGDISDYIGGLNHQAPGPGGYDLSSIGAASAAALAAHSSLAVLGISPHRAAMANYQDRAALVMRAREHHAAAHAAAAHRHNLTNQQAAAFLGGPGNYFPHLTQHSAATAALLNQSAALMGHSGMQQPVAQPVPSARIPPTSQDKSAQPSRKEQPVKKEQPPKEATPKSQPAPKKTAPQNELPRKDAVGKEQGGTKPSENPKATAPATGSADTQKPKADKDEKSEEASKKKRPLSDPEPGKPEKKVAVSEEKKGSPQKPTEKPAEKKEESGTKSASETNAGPVDRLVVEPKQESKPVESANEKTDPKSLAIVNSKAPTTESPSVTTKPQGSEAIGKSAGQPKADIPTMSSQNDAKMEDVESTAPAEPRGMPFFVPPAPPTITAEIAALVLAAKCSKAIELAESNTNTCPGGAAAVEYLMSVGAAVPIPKALVAGPLKDKILSCPGPRGGSSSSGIVSLPREVMVSSILLWLWKHHEECFQRAFAKSGRIDVDPECKWLIHEAVDATVRALALRVASTSKASMSIPGALSAVRSKAQKGTDAEKAIAATKLEVVTALVVCKALNSALCIDDQMDSAIPQFNDLVQYLDECRKCALTSKSQERALLASLISRRATMSLPFSHAYVSSMVRAGEALGHGELFEIVQDEEVQISTMIPYDVFTDESGAWEDPCRPVEGFTLNLTGDDLMRRAHARAMMQKSLKKLQDRHSIRGGVPTPGPYADPANLNLGQGGGSESGGRSVSGSHSGGSTPRGWTKQRRGSFSEPPVQPGTGSAPAKSWALYDPRHYSSPLLWKSDDLENSPYGSQSRTARKRSYSLSQVAHRKSAESAKKLKRSMSVASYESTVSESAETIPRSTREIAWGTVAEMFQSVTLLTEKKVKKQKTETTAPGSMIIFAPYVQQITDVPDPKEEESDEEEDLSDEAVLARHQVVLDNMKEKLSEILQARKKQQERRKSSSKK